MKNADYRSIHDWFLVLCLFGVVGLPSNCESSENVLDVGIERAFPQLRFSRPVIVTNAGDGTNRVFVASQLGKILVFPNRDDVAEADVFLDIESNVTFRIKQNEEGLLGLAFHPNYEENGEFFVYYSTSDASHTSVISRFRVSENDPNQADAESEEELLRIKQPYWNHNGGTIVFGPDGYLYIGLGDGGSRDDPEGNGQNLATLLGSILRIDVDNKDSGRDYAIPNDNPFVGVTVSQGAGSVPARPEIWAYGLRNVWRMAFDPQTGKLWAADVGQDIWEEVNIIQRGGNYGWNRREGRHRFGVYGAEPSEEFIEPIWEYHHDVGKSITGGTVYRGKRVPQLYGAYLFADYVAGTMWALRYDHNRKQVTDVNSIPTTGIDYDGNPPVVTFGEDETGEIVFSIESGQLYRFVSLK